MTNALERISNNVVIVLTARLTMVAMPLVTWILWVAGTNYLDIRFDQTDRRLQTVERLAGDANSKADSIGVRTSTLEATTAMGRTSREAQYQQLAIKLEKLSDSQATMAANISGLNALLSQVLQEPRLKGNP